MKLPDLRRFVSNVLAIAYREGTRDAPRPGLHGGRHRAADHDAAALRRRALERAGQRALGGARPEPQRRCRAAWSRRSTSTGYFLRAARASRARPRASALLERGAALAFVVIPQRLPARRAARRARGAGPARRRRSAHRGARRRHHPLAWRPASTRTRAARARAQPAPRAGVLDVRERFWFNATLRDRDFFLAALAGMLLTNLCLSIPSLGLVGERENGTYEQTLSLPTTPLEIVLGKLLPYVAVSYVVLAFAVLGAGRRLRRLARRELARAARAHAAVRARVARDRRASSRRSRGPPRRPSSSPCSSSCPRSCSRA